MDKKNYTAALWCRARELGLDTDELHLVVRKITRSDSISALSDKQKICVLKELERYGANNRITVNQRGYIFRLMYLLIELSPKDTTLSERLSGVIQKVTGKSADSSNPLRGISKAEAAEVIETLKRYIDTENRKKARESDG